VKPFCFQLAPCQEGVELYVLECSTGEALAVLDPAAPVEVFEFGASGADGTWTTAAALPAGLTVQGLRSFLHEHDELTLIDFTAAIGPQTRLGTHDDGEAQFLLPDEPAALAALRRLVPEPVAEEVVATVLANRGRFVVRSDDGSFSVFETFDDFVRRNK
jgi:hypothetical protein